MLKQIQNIGKSLTKKEQLNIQGGFASPCRTAADCQFVFGPHSNPTGDYSCVYMDPYNQRVCVSNY
ncbi:hypothetical protein [Tenacibaculum jejuense]|uniref:hypothetical protein n=1 Tax=Tenacibaculum jejuense TaxID=584609 RepID=UPI000BA4D7E9|nr:hypothetical protein [Tenacibaculum jejuense]